jgi:hypothetical protein
MPLACTLKHATEAYVNAQAGFDTVVCFSTGTLADRHERTSINLAPIAATAKSTAIQ